MSTNHTTNYNLNQWLATDQVKRTEFNEDNAKIDAALKNLADQVTEHGQELVNFGNCEIETFSYTGTGTYGSGNRTALHFTKPPLLFLILGNNGSVAFGSKLMSRYVVACTNSILGATASWSGSTVYIYHSVYAEYQMNTQNQTYRVFGLAAKDEA